MSLTISAIQSVAAAAAPAQVQAPAAVHGEFASMLESAVGRVETYRTHADQAVNQLLSGENGELHNVALATQQAELAFELGLQVRNKVVSAYQEVMRMQI